MKKGTKTALVVAAILMALGIVVCAVGFGAVNFKFSGLGNEKVTITTFMIDESFENIKIDTDVCSIRIEPSRDGSCHVEARELEQLSYNYDVQSNTLVISEVDIRSWYENISFSFAKAEVALLLPEAEYNTLSFNSDTGDIYVGGDISFKNVNIDTDTGNMDFDGSKVVAFVAETDTGDISLVNTSCMEFIADTNTGNIDMKKLIATGSIKINTDTGDVNFDGCDAASLDVDTDTGNVKGTLLSPKTFITETDTGSVFVPHSSSGGNCKIVTDTGDIKIDIK